MLTTVALAILLQEQDVLRECIRARQERAIIEQRCFDIIIEEKRHRYLRKWIDLHRYKTQGKGEIVV